jgi:hypothetical protein
MDRTMLYKLICLKYIIIFLHGRTLATRNVCDLTHLGYCSHLALFITSDDKSLGGGKKKKTLKSCLHCCLMRPKFESRVYPSQPLHPTDWVTTRQYKQIWCQVGCLMEPSCDKGTRFPGIHNAGRGDRSIEHCTMKWHTIASNGSTRREYQ